MTFKTPAFPASVHARRLASLAFVALASAGLATGAHAQDAKAMDHSDHSMHKMAPQGAAAPANAMELTDGEVTRWNPATGKVTIRHAEIKNLDMPAMTMVFALRNPDDGAALKAGDKVRFHAESADGSLVITRIEVVAQ